MAVNFLKLLTVVLITLSKQFWQVYTYTDSTYHAGVVEFTPAIGPKSTSDTLRRMREIIESEEAKDLDILVFPEHVLNVHGPKTYVPDAQEHIAPCDTPNYATFLAELSCSARSRRLYLVVNLLESIECTPQTATECDKQYNTNVVFDRNGVVIVRYRKTHLYGDEWYSTTVVGETEIATFSTDFGVTFGTFICFDMLFQHPAMTLVNELNITDIIYPTYWFSELPFLTAVQLQEGWAYANDVNLLAADASRPSGQNTGSGIYAGKLGRLVAVIHEEPTTRLLKAHVPKRIHAAFHRLPPVVQPIFEAHSVIPRFTKMSLLRDYNVDIFSTKLLSANFTSISESVCHGYFCCRFIARRNTINSTSPDISAYRFRVAAYSGIEVTFQRVDPADLSICALFACTNDELWSCGRIFPENRLVGHTHYFAELQVSGNFRLAKHRLIMPSTVDGMIMPLPMSMYEMKQIERSNVTNVEISLTFPKTDILTFGIWANYYNPRKVTHNLKPPSTVSGKDHQSANIASLAFPQISFWVIAVLLVFVKHGFYYFH